MRISLRARLQQDSPLVATLVTLNSPDTAEILTRCGFDWFFLDMEHSPLLDLPAAQRITQIVQPKAYSIIRVPSNDIVWIKKVLDIGCDGIIIPHVNNIESAQTAVSAAKYPPQGNRSFGIARAQGYGAAVQSCLNNANKDVAVIVQIEHIDAVLNIDKILKAQGVDGAFIGPFDLSGSLAKFGDITCPEVQQAIAEVRKAAQKADVPLGIYTGTAEGAQAEIAAGTRLIAIGSDTLHIFSAANTILSSVKHALAD